MKTFAGRMLLALLVVWAVGSLAIFTSFLWTPFGTLGMESNYGGVITRVSADSPAADADVTAGDRVDLAATSFDARPKLVGVTTPVAPGTLVTFRVERGSVSRTVSLIAARAYETGAQKTSRILVALSASIFIVVGAGLIWLRPSLVTWGFGLYGLLCNPIAASLSRFPSASAHLFYVAIYDVLQIVGVVGLLVFALNFPHTLNIRLRSALVRALPVIFVLLAAWTLSIDLCVCLFAVGVHVPNVLLQLAFGAVDVLAVALITQTYVKGPPANRPRLRWVLVGFYAGLLCNYIGNFLLYTGNVALPEWLDATLIAIEATLPLTVSYAIVRHRVLEIDLFLSRALVYAALTTFLVLLFGVTDWVFGRVLADFRVSLVVDAGISVGAALLFDRANKTLERLVSRIVFRGRQLAYDRITRVSHTFRFVHDMTTLDHALVIEPHEALGIQTVALFRRDGERLKRVAEVGWGEQSCALLEHDDRLALEHSARDGAVDLRTIPWTRHDVPSHGAPVVSIPLRTADTVDGILLCSNKRNGEGLDVEELRLLEEFAAQAAVAYERLDSEHVRNEVRDLRAQVALLGARLDEARRA